MIVHQLVLHSSIKSDWGFIGRYIFVSPSAHRIHHSIKREHYGKNFGNTFIFWDRLFKTFIKPDNTYNIEKTLEEYDNELYELSTNIVYGNYNIILSKLLKKYEEYSMEFSMCYNLEKTSIMYEVLTKEYCKFIKCYMKYDVENCNYNTENEEMIVFKMSSCMKKEEKKRYKNHAHYG